MKTLLVSFCLIVVTSISTLRADDLPKRLDLNRYTAMLKRSPFAIATAPVQAPTAPNWSKDLYIANAMHTNEADYATVISGGDKNMHEPVSTIEPNSHGYMIANIQWSEQQGETKVTISKDGQYATLGFNQALVGSASPAMAPPPTGLAAPNPNVGPKPFPTPVATPQPHVRGVIERNPRVAQPPNAGAPMVAPPNQEQ